MSEQANIEKSQTAPPTEETWGDQIKQRLQEKFDAVESAIQEVATCSKPDFDGIYREKYCEMLVEWMARGNSFPSFAAFVGVSQSVLDSWLDEYPRFEKAKEIGEAMEFGYLEKLAKLYAEGHIQGNATIMKYLMSNRMKAYSEKPEENVGDVIYEFEGLDRSGGQDASDLAEKRPGDGPSEESTEVGEDLL